ncbi:MAG TPA: hypothetical protein DDZ89_21515 [Clostridiales bacterium]|nr:hypothetical protein [Clostridiales bacterium]
MKKIIQKIFLFFMAAFMLLYSSSCQSNNGNPEQSVEMFTHEYVPPVKEQLDLTDVKILLPYYSINQYPSVYKLNQCSMELSAQALDFLNCTVTIDHINISDYTEHFEKAIHSGIPYDIVILQPSQINKEYACDVEFLYKPWVDKGFIKDITEDVGKFFSKGVIYTDLIKNAKSPEGRIYAIPKITKVMIAYGALCRNEVLQNYDKKEINGYTDFIRLIDENIRAGVDLNVNVTLSQLLNMNLNEHLMLSISSSNILYDRLDKKFVYLEDTDNILETVLGQYKKYFDMGIIESSYPLQQKDYIYVNDYIAFKYKGHIGIQEEYARFSDAYSLFLVGGENNSFYYNQSTSAVAIPVTSQETERALMLLSLLNSDNSMYADTLLFGVEDKDYTKTEDNKILLKELPDSYGFLYWGDYLLNFDSIASTAFSYEANSDAWRYCILNARDQDAILGLSVEKVWGTYGNMPDEIKKHLSGRVIPVYKELNKIMAQEDAVESIIQNLKAGQNEELYNWIVDYLSP